MSNDLGYAAQAAVAYKDPVTVGWGQQVLDNITAIANLLKDYQKGCRLSYVATGTIEVGTGSIMINGHPRSNTTTSTVTFANSDNAGYTEASSTAYYVWAFASGSTSIFQVGLNNTASNHTGQANARLLGWVWNGTGCAIEKLYDQQYGSILGKWENRSELYSTGQYAFTDGFVLAYNAGNPCNINGYTDSNAAPTTQVTQNYSNGAASFTMPVKRGNYWKVEVTAGGSATVYFLPHGGSIM